VLLVESELMGKTNEKEQRYKWMGEVIAWEGNAGFYGRVRTHEHT
jgi:hypothetical protein